MSFALLNDLEIRALTEKADQPLLSGYLDFDTQLQPSGFDVTVRNISRLFGRARLGGPYQSKIASEEAVEAVDDIYVLRPGSYIVQLNEVTAFPLEIAGLALPRSTLFRCGATLSSGLWDPGFHGRGRLGMTVGIDELEIMQDAPFAQLIFFRTSQAGEGFAFNDFYER